MHDQQNSGGAAGATIGLAHETWGALDDFDVRAATDTPTRHDVLGAELPLSALAVRRPGARRLVVHLHGTLNRASVTLPRFERLRTLSELDTNLLLLADTTLTVEPSLPTAWYVGTPEVALTDRYSALIRAVIEQWGIEHTVIAGASSGGFAALALAPRVPEALSVAFSPQTRIRLRPTARPFRQFVYNRFGGWDGIEARPELRPRVDLTQLYDELPGGRTWYVQNTGDAEHMEQHAAPFMAAHPDRVTMIEEYHCPGHNPPSPRRVTEWIQQALDSPGSDPLEFVKRPPPEVPIIVR
ncbi:hypothetical protein AA0Z99_08505 [Agrococcus sp. 1P02AA]|uniref:alpha/beta fold hydrolase n=1 Tax=Agrococcus sp. 1P02AA TaxID=3132259 RepID=UPI0039A4AD16